MKSCSGTESNISSDETTNNQDLRYAASLLVPEFGEIGQARIAQAQISIVGAGGVGAPVLTYLAAAGVGSLRIIDDDQVDLGNLQRQFLFSTTNLGERKVTVAATRLKALNPSVNVQALSERLTMQSSDRLLSGCDLLIDASDNYATRIQTNAFAQKRGVGLIFGSAVGMDGQAAYLRPASGRPCYRCLFPREPAIGSLLRCDEAGVLGPVVGVIGSFIALLALRLLAGHAEPPKACDTLQGNRLWLWSGMEMNLRSLDVARNPTCPECGTDR